MSIENVPPEQAHRESSVRFPDGVTLGVVNDPKFPLPLVVLDMGFKDIPCFALDPETAMDTARAMIYIAQALVASGKSHRPENN